MVDTMLHIRIAPELRQRLQICAAAEGTSMTAIVAKLVEGYVAKNIASAIEKVKG